MPLYEFACDACGARVEKIQKHSDPPPDRCAACGKGPMVRQMSSPAIQFKGSGFYITDYAKKGGPPAESSSAGKSETSEKSERSEKSEKAGKAEKTGDAAASTSSDTAKSQSTPAPAATPKPSSES